MATEEDLRVIVTQHRDGLAKAVMARRRELLEDDTRHHELYRMLGVPPAECEPIDLYQNVGRFVFKYAGALLEYVTRALLDEAGDGGPISIPNTVSANPKRFEIDCYTKLDNKAHEIKWRDATTDGDHIRKETNKIASILEARMVPVRIMYYMPVRTQAIRIQERILDTFRSSGEAYVGDDAWAYVKNYSGIDLEALLKEFDFPHPDWLEIAHQRVEDASE